MSQIAVLGVVGIVAFAIAIIVSVMLHEAGHFFFARKFGMKATEFFVGFGPRLFSKKVGETEYGVKVIPAGGYVRILGMTPLEQLDPADEPRAFYRQKAWPRFMVLVAGSLTHFVLGFVLLVVLLVGVGLPVQAQTLTLESISPCVPTANDQECSGGSQTPAAKAGLRPGDRVVAFDGTKVASWGQLSGKLHGAGGKKVTLTVVRGGRTRQVPVTLAKVKDAKSGQQVGFLGVVSKQRVVRYETYNIASGTLLAGQVFGREIGLIFQTLGHLPGAIPKLFSPERATTQGGQVGSVVGAARTAGGVFGSDESGREKAGQFIDMLQGVNVFIGVFNLLPLLPMDGGHIAVLFWERIRAFVARRRGRPDPGPVDMAKLLPATYLVFVVLVGLGVLLIAADVVNPLPSPF